ncbi:MAG: HlyD family efflux transporter periplasmic adaptor subunit [Planctomycetota bacterium]
MNQQRSLTRIHAGDAGLVDTVLKQPGEWVDQGETILTLLDLRRVRISGIASQQQVSPADCLLAQLIVDRDARSADNPDQVVPMRGHVTHIDAKRLPGGRFRFHAIVDNVVLQSKSQNASTRPGAAPQWALMPGQSVRVRLVTPPVGRVTDVPRLNRR